MIKIKMKMKKKFLPSCFAQICYLFYFELGRLVNNYKGTYNFVDRVSTVGTESLKIEKELKNPADIFFVNFCNFFHR